MFGWQEQNYNRSTLGHIIHHLRARFEPVDAPPPDGHTRELPAEQIRVDGQRGSAES
jgi:hypothetical protein